MNRTLGALSLISLAWLAGCKPAGDAAPTVDAGDGSAPAVPAPTPATPEPEVRARFRCGDLLVGARFDNAAERLVLSLPGRELTLPRAISASGARYADTSGNEFWNKGNTATFTLDGAAQPDCVETDETSPWDEARARGVAFRGLGNEPGWWVEVDAGNTSALRAELDYGERRVDVPSVRPLDAGHGYSGIAADGTEVTLDITHGDCSDGMSDQTYPASVRLQVGDRRYEGCGIRLAE